MYVDSVGNSPGLILGLVALCALLIVALTSCSPSSSAEPEAPENITDGNFTYHYSKDEYDVVDGCVNYNVSRKGEVTNIKIYNSINCTDEADKEEILNYIIKTHKSEYTDLSADNIDYYIKEWSCHNCAYWNRELLAFLLKKDVNDVKKSSVDVDLNTNDPNREDYEKWGGSLSVLY